MKKYEEKRDRSERDSRGDGRDGGDRKSFQRKKGCRFCNEPALFIDYKDKYILAPFLSERSKIAPGRVSGNCASHQRELTIAVKRARHIAIIPYSSVQN